MQIRNLQTFVKVFQLGSFHAAAKHLHTSQPAVSARINSLENELGVMLFERDKSGTRLTARGQQLLSYAEKIVATAEQMKDQVKDLLPERGVIRIGVSDTLAYLWLSDILRHWQQQFPLMEFEINVDVSSTLCKQLKQQQLDLALVVDEDSNTELHQQALCQYPQVWVAQPGLAEKFTGSSIVLEQLLLQPILSFPKNTRPWQQLQQLLNSCNNPALLEQLRLHSCSSLANLLPLAEQGIGIALLPEPTVAKALAEGRLKQLTVEAPAAILNFCACWRKNDERILPSVLCNAAREIIGKSQI